MRLYLQIKKKNNIIKIHALFIGNYVFSRVTYVASLSIFVLTADAIYFRMEIVMKDFFKMQLKLGMN